METGKTFGSILNALVDELLVLAVLATVLEFNLPLLLATAWLDCRHLFRQLALAAFPKLLDSTPRPRRRARPIASFCCPCTTGRS